MKIGIIGLGLMGGSLSLALKATGESYHFVGFDRNELHRKQALELSLVDEIATTIDEIIVCDVIILTIPVDGIIDTLQKLTTVDERCTIIDFGSTKAKIIDAVPKAIRRNFIAAHPMTGTEKFGPTAALATLYDGKTTVLCDLTQSGFHQQGVVQKLFGSIGMRLVTMDSKEHDRHAAFISHMPHALSFALANAVMAQEDPKSIIALAGGGFRDMSRIAKSSPNMWEDIFRQNKENMVEAIDCFTRELQNCKTMIENEEWQKLNSWMGSANKLHEIL